MLFVRKLSDFVSFIHSVRTESFKFDIMIPKCSIGVGARGLGARAPKIQMAKFFKVNFSCWGILQCTKEHNLESLW